MRAFGTLRAVVYANLADCFRISYVVYRDCDIGGSDRRFDGLNQEILPDFQKICRKNGKMHKKIVTFGPFSGT